MSIQIAVVASSGVTAMLARGLHELLPLLPWMFMMGGSLVTVATLKILGLASTGAFLTLMGGGYFATNKSKPEQSTVNIEAGKFFKVGWQGASALGLLVAGILLIALAFHTSEIS